jgi:hypothetical protein
MKITIMKIIFRPIKTLQALITFCAFITLDCGGIKTITAPPEPYEEIITCEGTKAGLYVKANEWMVKTFNNAESVIEFQDKEEGRIIGKYLLKDNTVTTMYGQWGENIFAMINIYVRDNGVRISIKPQDQWNYGESGFSSIYNYSVEDAEKDIRNLIADFKNHMLTQETNW